MKNLTPLDINILDFCEEIKDNSTSLQRTEQWRIDRLGCWNGSTNHKLMSCGRSTSKMSWGEVSKTFDFGESAETYIYRVGKERNTKLLSQEVDSQQLRHGRENEPLFIEQLIKDGVLIDFKELGSEVYPKYKNIRASVDGLATYVGSEFLEFNGKELALELKCCVSWDGHKKRMYEPVNEKHSDFWQHQTELLVTGKPALLYCVAMPMQVEKYDIQIVRASEIHQKELIKRAKIADLAISRWDGFNYRFALEEACMKFENEIINL